MSDNQLVPVKPALPAIIKHKDADVLSFISYEKVDQSHYSFTYQFEDDIALRMDESDKTAESTVFVDAEFDSNISESDKAYYTIAAASGVLTGVLSMLHLNAEQLKSIEEFKEKEWKPIIINVANFIGYKKNDYNGASKYLVNHAVKTIEKNEKTKELMTVLSQHPSLAGLVFSTIAQFSGNAVVISESGVIKHQKLPDYYAVGETNSEKIVCAFFYWLFSLAANEAESKRHIIDELGVSKDLIKKIKEFANIPFLKNIPSEYQDAEVKFSAWLEKILKDVNISDEQLVGNEQDGLWINIMRVALNLAEDSFPVLINECIIRGLYMVVRICSIVKEQHISTFDELAEIPALDIVPLKGKAVSRMCLIGSASFVSANIASAVLKAVKEKKVNGRNFADTFFAELNIAGVGRFLFACAADSKYWGEDIRVFFQRKAKSQQKAMDVEFEEVDGGEAFSPLTLDVVQARILYSLESVSVTYDIKHSSKQEDKEAKEGWLDEWKTAILKCAGVPDEYFDTYFVEDEDILYEGIFQLAKDRTNWSWFYLLTLEMALFKPYYALGTGNDKKYKKLKQESDYLRDQFVRRQTIASQSEVDAVIKTYSKYKGYVSGSTQNKIIGVGVAAAAAVATGGMALTFAPGIAAAIAGEAVVGLHGAALTSASLAFVGGGSLAAGGLGMAGGTAIITGGGALLGLAGSGTVSATAVLLQTPSDYWVRQSAKLLTYSNCILSQNLKDKNSVHAILQAVAETITTIEATLQTLKEADNELDKELIKKTSEYLIYLKRCHSELQKIEKE